MHVYFDAAYAASEGAGPATAGDGRPTTTGRMPLLPISPDVLRRHGARVLEPERAWRLSRDPQPPGDPQLPADLPPRPTIYRYGTLLLPVRPLAQDEQAIGTLNDLLTDSGMRLVGRPEHFRAIDRPDARTPPTVRVALDVASPGRPAAIDAWAALQSLRGAVRSREVPASVAEVVKQASLEHLLMGAGVGAYQDPTGAWQGSPIGAGGEAVASYLTPAFGARTPVVVVAPPPPRTAPTGRRRPVVAVLDTGVGENPWLGIPAPGNPLPPGGPVRVDEDLQQIVRDTTAPGDPADPPLLPIDDHWDTPVTDEPLVGRIDSHTGHGVFIAGLIAQIAQDADVLSVRLMHSDGIVYEQTVLAVLDELIHRIERVQAGQLDASHTVDIVAVSFGYYDETADNQAATPLLRQRLQSLVDLGVLVVASAGNDAATLPFYPAALSTQLASPLMRSVGALNPNGTATLFSNDGGSVNTWATGAMVVSTFPLVEGSRRPANTVAPRPGANGRLPSRREALDPDGFTHGHACWSGASFAAPIAAAVLANKLILNGENDPDLGLNTLTLDVTMKRARAAVQGAIDDTLHGQ